MIKLKELFLNSTINFLKKYNSYTDNELVKLKYGLEGLYLTITKVFIIIIVAILLNVFVEVLITLLLFNIIRFFCFGFHAEKSYQCLILSLFNFIFIPLFFLKVSTSFFADLIICIICFLFILLFAPADTPKRPLKNKKKRLIRKFLSSAVALIYMLIIVIFNKYYISQLLISCLIITVIVISPLTYKIFGQTYNNYKRI